MLSKPTKKDIQIFVLNLPTSKVQPSDTEPPQHAVVQLSPEIQRSDSISPQSPRTISALQEFNHIDSVDSNVSKTSRPRRRSSLVNFIRSFSFYPSSRRDSLVTVETKVTQAAITEEKYRELLRDPIPPQYLIFFENYFNDDIRSKKFTVDDFCRLFQMTPVLGERLLRIFEQDEAFVKNSIDGIDVLRIARLLLVGTMSVKALILFKMFDQDRDGKISLSEMKQSYQQYLKEFKVSHDETRTNEIIDIFLKGFTFVVADGENDGEEQMMDFDQFYSILKSNDDLLHTLHLI
ncbi:unnamed protein product, partial [Didymodactylos carnosus]